MEEFGIGWMENSIKRIREDKYQQYQILSMLIPLARTPMEQKGGRAMQKYSKDVSDTLLELVPWMKKKHGRSIAHYRGKAKPGETVVVLDSGETADNPLFKGAKIVRQK